MTTIADRIRERHKIAADRPVGVRGVWPKIAADVDMDAREIMVICNTDDLDSDDEVVVPGGLDFGPMKKNNGRIFLDHRYTAEYCVGKVRSIQPVGLNRSRPTAWAMKAFILSGGLGDDMLSAAREVGIGASIGFVPTDMGPPDDSDPPHYRKAVRIIRKAEVYEISLTMLPANVSCQAAEVSHSYDEEHAPMQARMGELVTKGRIRRESALIMGWTEPEAPARKTITFPVGKVIRFKAG